MAKHRSQGAQAVILHADIADSTGLVLQDKRLAYQRIQDSFGRFSNSIEKYYGHVLEIRGDILLAEFRHAADAVSASLAFQDNQASYNERLRDEPRPVIRVGIAMGEIIIADNTVTGWGVVQAQRIEQIAQPGGVYVTTAINQALPESLPIDIEELGENTLSNFDYPDTQSVYRVKLKPGESIPPPDEDRKPEEPASSQRLMVAVIAATLIIIGGAAYWLIF
jgi:adenylate cyclase